MANTTTTANLGITIPSSGSPDYEGPAGTLAAALNTLEAVTHGIIADTGAANALAIALPAGVALAAGAAVMVKVKAANTGATTIAVNGGTAVAVQKHGVALAGSEFSANMIALLAYDGTHWQVVNL